MAEAKTNVELAKLNVTAGSSVPVDISIFAGTQIVVYLTDARVVATPVTDYGIELLAGSTTFRDGFRLTITPSMVAKIVATGLPNKIYVRRRTALTTEFSETDAFLRDRIVNEFDKTIMRMQEISGDIASAVRTPLGEAVVILPGAATRAGKLLEFDANGLPIAINSVSSVQGNAAQTALDRVQTGLDRVATGQDRVQTGLDRVAAAGSAGAATNAANDASDQRALAQTARTDAQTARGGAETARTGAETAQGLAQGAKTAAETAQGGAQTARTGAETALGLVNTAKTAVDTAKGQVDTAKTAVDTAKTAVDAGVAAVRALYQGALAADPSTDLGGVALTTKAYYYNIPGAKYRFYNGSAWQDSPISGGGTTGSSEVGQCKLVYVSPTSIRLDPNDGNFLMIDGTVRAIPSGGVALSNSGMASATLYYIYASWSGTAIVLNFATQAPVRRTDNGQLARTGTLTQSLVGMVYTNASAQFTAPSGQTLYIRSHYNDPSANLGSYSATQTANAGTTFNELLIAHRINVLLWPGEEVNGMCAASAACDTAAAAVRLGVGFNTASASTGLSLIQVPVANLFNPISVALNERAATAAASVYFIAPLVFTSGGTAQFAHVQQTYRTTRSYAY